ncbi:YheC/YheD family endospore coat-associated protein [Priestia endophytica]|uniref:YheC/D like ATP-grasp n=1 Tax=Priestia endophytica DSM 13796 TaxID=1121089 RepID=A0A1I6AS09_9BACI|nr:YheC/YheD family protein [Priestia endophytica]KYG31083.1 hypothetical protein AZF06_04845 [Priestia endophytica]SFQ71379.1 YheC/D like ATP-grasp [Priestia endophytica DSM 13796]
MTFLYYNKEKECFFHKEASSLLFGKKMLQKAYDSDPFSYSFSVKLYQNRLGPLIGILISPRQLKTNKEVPYEYFLHLHTFLTNSRAFPFFFTAESFKDDYISGYILYQEKWKKIKVPLPDVVYNRISSRKYEQKKKVQRLFKTLKKYNIPFFNKAFFSKEDMHDILNSHPFLKRHIPPTLFFTSKHEAQHFLKTHKKIYVKPIHGRKGKGIFIVDVKENFYVVEDFIETRTYQTFNDFYETELAHKHNKVILQQALPSASFQDKRYDLRLLMHRSADKFLISGIGVRQAGTQSLTTHVPKGGKIIPFENIHQEINMKQVEEIAHYCGEQLIKLHPFVGEFSIDMLKTPDNRYYVLELNAKPMIFDEEHIRTKGAENLHNLFIELSFL